MWGDANPAAGAAWSATASEAFPTSGLLLEPQPPTNTITIAWLQRLCNQSLQVLSSEYRVCCSHTTSNVLARPAS
jgi:hypothetical protein